MPNPRTPDFLAQSVSTTRRVRDLEIAAPESEPIPTVENFVMAPVAVAAWPPALALRSSIIGVMGWNLDGGSGGTIKLAFNYHSLELNTDFTIHTFGAFTLGFGTFWQWDVSFDIGGRVELGLGDYYWPEVTAGSGTNVVAGFVILPNAEYGTLYP